MRRLPLLVVSLLVLWPAAATAAPALQADFSTLTRPNNQMGFMHGALTHYRFDASNAQAIARARLLLPGIWRGADEPWSMDSSLAQELGATPIIILSDYWNSVTPEPKPGCQEQFLNRPLPFQDLTAWRQFVRQQAEQLAARQPSGTIWVDIWNEPDWFRFWPVKANPRCFSSALVDRDGSKWLATFLAAEQVLRQQLGSRVKIVGPSAATSVMLWTERLVRFCAPRGCRIDGVSWHLAGGTQGSVDRIGLYTRQLRALLATNATWKKASAGPATKILMTEYLPAPYRLMPGALVAYWYALEGAGVDGGSLAEWNDRDARLNSLLEFDGTPRSLWWAARAYALGRAARVRTSTSDGHWSLLATRSGLSEGPELLVGNNDSRPGPLRVTLSGLDALGWRGTLAARVVERPQVQTRPAPMAALPAGRPLPAARISAGRATLTLTPPRGGALLVALSGR